MKSIGRRFYIMFMATALSAGLFACGGGYDDGYSPPPVPIISEGTMTTGSAIVNGIRFEDTAANITADDSPKTLGDGMTVKVKGTRNNDGTTGTADRIEVENEVRGSITSLGPDSFIVLGQTVFVDDRTIYENVTGIAFLLAGDNVEVHGQRKVNEDIVATRVEFLGIDPTQVQDEVRGIVSSKDTPPSTFTIGALLISYDTNTEIVPAVATTFDNTNLVEVHLDVTVSPPLATRIELEDLEDDEFEPAEGQEFEIEGFVTGLAGTLPDVSFALNGQQVLATSGTRYEGGIAGDLADNVKVEVEGQMGSGISAGILVADKISFKDTVRIESNAGSTSGAAAPTSFTGLGKNVLITSATELNITLPIANGAGVKVRGFVNNDGISITATRIDSTSTVASDRHILQGPVSNIVATGRTFEIAGVTVDASSVPVADVQDDNDQVITIDQFFASLTANRTIVKVRGTFSTGTIAANSVALE